MCIRICMYMQKCILSYLLFPPQTMVAPLVTQSFTCCSTLSTPAELMRGPKWTPCSRPSPILYYVWVCVCEWISLILYAWVCVWMNLPHPVCMGVCVWMNLPHPVCMGVCVNVRMHACTCVGMHMYICTCIHACMLMKQGMHAQEVSTIQNARTQGAHRREHTSCLAMLIDVIMPMDACIHTYAYIVHAFMHEYFALYFTYLIS